MSVDDLQREMELVHAGLEIATDMGELREARERLRRIEEQLAQRGGFLHRPMHRP